ncbi:hypothetical protein ABK040_011721 [Willaertia magna]
MKKLTSKFKLTSLENNNAVKKDNDNVIRKFLVTISNIKITDLPNTFDSDGLGDPYVKGNFDGYRSFETSFKWNELNPNWEDFKIEFEYFTKFYNKLDLKMLRLEIYNKNVLEKDDWMCHCEINLFLLAVGPKKRCLTLTDQNGKYSGKIEFDCLMEEISNIKFTILDLNLKFKDDFNAPKDIYCNLHQHIGSLNDLQDKNKFVETDTLKDVVNNCNFKNIHYLLFKDEGLQKFVNENIYILIKHSKRGIDHKIGKIKLQITKEILKEYLINNQIILKSWNKLNLNNLKPIELTNIPILNQFNKQDDYLDELIDNYKENKKKKKNLLLESAESMYNFIPAHLESTDQMTSGNTGFDVNGLDNNPINSIGMADIKILLEDIPIYSPLPIGIQLDDKIEGISWLDILPSFEKKPQVLPSPEELKEGWEIKVDRNSGRVYYVDHINKKTQWDPPLKI